MRNKFDVKHIQSLCQQDNSSIFPCMDASTALDELCRYFLGAGWYDTSGAISPEQVNVNIVIAIERQYKGAKLKRKVIYE